MTAAALILAINLFTASVLSVSFAVFCRCRRTKRGEFLLAIAYGLVALHALLEFAQPFLATAEPGNFIVFLTYLGAMTIMVAGVAQRLAVFVPPMLLLGLLGLGVPIYLALLGLERHDPVRPLLYQTPFVLVQLAGCWVIWRSKRNLLNSLLLGAFLMSAIVFAAKPLLAFALGIGPNTQSFLASDYGALSQTLEAFFLISTGVLLLFAVARDMLIEVTLRSETDQLSGLLNRRGFEERCERVIAGAAHSNEPMVMILADLDHFKDINDSFGHAVGDRVIAAFARVLRSSTRAANEAFVGRVGGEEFGVLLSGGVVEGRNYAETARKAFAGMTFDDIGPHSAFTASFGIAEFQHGETMPDLLRRADSALYEAKRSGRNKVHVSQALSVVPDRDNPSPRKAAAPDPGGR